MATTSRRKRKPIRIKKANRGKFTAYAKRNKLSMSQAISKGKKSKSAAVRKRAVFAQNARKWRKKGRRRK